MAELKLGLLDFGNAAIAKQELGGAKGRWRFVARRRFLAQADAAGARSFAG